MSAAHGRLTRVYIGGYDLTGFYRKTESELSREMAETTSFNQADKTYLPGLRDATASLEGLYDGAADGIAEVLHAAFSADPLILTICPQGDALGNVAYGLSSLETSYAIEAAKDDVVTLSNEVQASAGRDRLIVHHALGSEVASGQSAAQDGGAATTNGGVGFLHVPNISGITNLAVVIEDSADGSTGWATILSFGGVTASRAKERVAITGTVRRYTRARWTFTGAGSAQCWVGFGRK